jgi:hypothetical protein
MTLRFCPRCIAEVENVGGFCLLGHPLRLDPLIPSVADIRAQVYESMDEVRLGTGAPMPAEREGHPTPAVERRESSPPPPPVLREAGSGRHTVWDSLEVEAHHEAPDRRQGERDSLEVEAHHQAPDRRQTVWDSLELETRDAGDPIAAFAPAPRMDWGPERSSFLGSLRRRESATPVESA